jgi:hypothetical protein
MSKYFPKCCMCTLLFSHFSYKPLLYSCLTNSLTHSHPGATTHVGSWLTQAITSNHLCPGPCSSNFVLPAFLHPSNQLSCIHFTLQCLLSLQSNNICFASSSPKHKGHLPLSAFCLTPFSCHIPASNHASPLLSFLKQHSMYNVLPQEKLNSLYSFSPEILLIYFVAQYHYISLSLALTFLSNYTPVVSSTQMPICYQVVRFSAP